MVIYFFLVVMNIVVNGICFVDLDYIIVVFRFNCFMILKDI